MPQVVEDPHEDRYVWLGAVTDKSFKVFLDVHGDERDLVVCERADFAEPLARRVVRASDPSPGVDPEVYGNLRHFHVGILSANTKYYVGLERADDVVLVASVSTLPPPDAETPQDVYIAFGSCQRGAGDVRALNEVAQWREAVEASRPDAAFIFLHAGDLHYGDIRRDDEKLYAAAVRPVVTAAHKLFRHCPVAATWDDHDYGANNSGFEAPARSAALAAHAAMVPKPSQDHVYHAFSVGRVRIVVTDLRSEARSDVLMGPEQLQFFFDELRAHEEYAALVWVSSRPWIETDTAGSDRWGGYAAQRREIANFIASHGVSNLVVLSGDAHMLAADDGRHTCYAEPRYGTQGFPVLHAAPLANFGTVKGGPYSAGTATSRIRKVRQYGLLSIRPGDGKAAPVELEFNGYRVSRPVDKPLLLLKKLPVLSLKMQAPFLADAEEPRIGCLRRVEEALTKCW